MEAKTTSTAAATLRASGLRVTTQRRVILDVFTAPGAGHLSADGVHERASAQLPELARATVYNTLNELVRAGLLRRIDGFGSALYDRNADGAHHHFHCRECGDLFDVEPAGAAAIALPDGGFEVERTEIMLRGRCPACAAASS
jgi:Fur family ferric uptake transcriptional regulator